MERPFFDIQSGREFFADEEGLRPPHYKAAEVEAMQTLLGITKGSVFLGERPDLAVKVRSTTGRLFCVSIVHRDAGTKH